MNIVDFNQSYLEQASKIALCAYEQEKKQVPILPEVWNIPDLSHYAENGMGVAAVEGDTLLGFLCAYSPFEDAFGTTGVRGTFSEAHAHGAASGNRDRIFSLLYQAAAEKWTKMGIRSHGIAFYTHDKEAINSFFYNGFGLRCIDAIRPMEQIPVEKESDKLKKLQISYSELSRDEWGSLLPLHNLLEAHLGQSPTFMSFEPMDLDGLYRHTGKDSRYFAAKVKNQPVAYIKIGPVGECFITSDKSMRNICGAYCLPEYRGFGIYQHLLNNMIVVLKKEGYTRLGVDCESINPTARGFWLKYFSEYTHSVVRRIDDKAVKD